MARVLGSPREVLAAADIERFIHASLDGADYTGKKVCVLVPDATRSCPLPALLDSVHAALHGRVAELTFMVALGTHPAMSEEQLGALLGYRPGHSEERYPGVTVRNHEWWDPAMLTSVGMIEGTALAALSDGRLTEPVDVRLNRAVVDSDVTLVVGPVFPHEVVGFSGGNKYLFPGVSGQEVIDVSHWLGALITSSEIIGTRGITPVRAMINEAASKVPSELRCLALVVESGTTNLHAITYGGTEDAWAAAADIAAEVDIKYLSAPVERVLSLVSRRYDEIWTAAKGMYKVEPVVADGGQVVLYAPHVTEVSRTHGEVIRKVGYHCRDYFVKQWDRYKDLPWGVLAHSTHLRGAGTYDEAEGEHCRVEVTLATGIDAETTRALSLSYLDPASIDIDEWSRDPGTLVVHDAGEILYRLH
ncbi:lactate racemase domain-containing protein [Actinoallomurus bryophytorum]|uniref:Nickel-dependent lactate racemase n=1 Tax=Actinoallomurus bryophytorum TaxID=1490222 RepID=A0A543BZX8_9ACTN|nr:lactate racemase domain-containing protein [Actinoallomurus bryophytorum]TQL90380.1 nickel-dependent lactate racemase [Actinoallomurus bryophytorum]